MEPSRSFDCAGVCIVLVGNSIREYSRYLQWYLPAGVKVRKPASVRMNQKARNYPFFDANANQKTRLFGGDRR